MLSPMVLKGGPTFSTFYFPPVEMVPFSLTISKENIVFQETCASSSGLSKRIRNLSRLQMVEVRVERVKGCLLQLQAWGSGQLRVGKTIDKTMSYLKMGQLFIKQ